MERFFFKLFSRVSLLGSFNSSPGMAKIRAIGQHPVCGRRRLWRRAGWWWSTPRHRLVLGWRSRQRQSSIKISLGEQRAYFYKGGVLVGVSQLSTGREGLNTPPVIIKSFKRTRTTPPLYSEIMWTLRQGGRPQYRHKKRSESARTHFKKGHRCLTLCASCPGDRLARRVFAGGIRLRTAASECLNSWRKISSNTVSVGTPVTITN